MLFFALRPAGAVVYDSVENVTYTVALPALLSTVETSAKWSPTFTDYLNNAVGAPLNVTFQTVALNYATFFLDGMNNNFPFDFMFHDSIFLTCVQTVFGGTKIASRRGIYNGTEFSGQGGVLFVRGDRDDLQTKMDVKDKTMSTGFLSLASTQLFYDMYMVGLDPMQDPAKVIFTLEPIEVVKYVMDGSADFGIMATGMLEGLVESGSLNASDYRVIGAEDVGTFPLASSTALLADWPLFAMSWVPEDVAKAVGAALADLNSTSTEAVLAGFSTWDTPYDYTPSLFLLEALGFVNSYGYCAALNPASVWSSAPCPDGYALSTIASTTSACSSCPTSDYGTTFCVCRPCVAVPDERFSAASLQAIVSSSAAAANTSDAGYTEVACSKMETCQTVAQLENTTFVIEDGWAEALASLDVAAPSYVELILSSTQEPLCFFPQGNAFDCANSTRYGTASDQGSLTQAAYEQNGYAGTSRFPFSFLVPFQGLVLVQYFVDGSEASESPFLLQVNARDCGELLSDSVADKLTGECLCPAGYRAHGSKCEQKLHAGTIVAIVIASAAFLVIAAGVTATAYRRALADSLWKIPASALVWPSPPVVLGRGTFGEVNKATFRGVDVAVKKMHFADGAGGSQHLGSRGRNSSSAPRLSRLFNSSRLRSTGSRISASLRKAGGVSKRIYAVDEACEENSNAPPPTPPKRSTLKAAPVVVKPASSRDDASSATPPSSPTPLLAAASPSSPLESERIRATDMAFGSGGGGGSTKRAIMSRRIDGGAAGNERSIRSVRSNFDAPTADGDGGSSAGSNGGFSPGSIGRRSGRLGGASTRFGALSATLRPRGIALLWRKLAGGRGNDGHSDFMAEVRVLSQLRHPNITTIMGVVLDVKPMLMVMELMESGSLYDILHNRSVSVEVDLVATVLRDVACGMTFLHESSILHNDMKAHNVLLDRSFKAKVADLGLASISKLKSPREKTAPKASKSSASAAASGALSANATGTPYWMAPELLRGGPPTTATDMYAFGITIFECLSREEPYDEHDDPYQVLRRVADPARVDPDVFRPTPPANVPKELAQMMTEAWSSDAALRPTFREMMQRLERLEKAHVTATLGAEAEATHGAMARRRNAQRRNSNGGGMPLSEASGDEDPEYSGLPRRWADAVRSGRQMDQEPFSSVCCVFTDIVSYSALSSKMTGEETVDLLDRLYEEFDVALKKQNMYNVDIIGDAYMAVSGLYNEPPAVQVERVCRWCIDAVRAANAIPVCPKKPELGNVSIRAGLHVGPCAAGVVGKLRPRFSLFGDTINVAARMESLSRENCVQLSAASARLLKAAAPDGELAKGLKARGEIVVKGKGTLETFFLTFDGCQDPFASSLKDHDVAGK